MTFCICIHRQNNLLGQRWRRPPAFSRLHAVSAAPSEQGYVRSVRPSSDANRMGWSPRPLSVTVSPGDHSSMVTAAFTIRAECSLNAIPPQPRRPHLSSFSVIAEIAVRRYPSASILLDFNSYMTISKISTEKILLMHVWLMASGIDYSWWTKYKRFMVIYYRTKENFVSFLG